MAMAVVLLAGIVYAPYAVPDINVDIDNDTATVQAHNAIATAGSSGASVDADAASPQLYGALPTAASQGEIPATTVTSGDTSVVSGPGGVVAKSGDTIVNTQGGKIMVKTGESMVMVNGNKVSVKNILADTAISTDEAEALESIKISPGKIQVGDVVVTDSQKKVMVRAGGANVEVSAGPTSVVIKDGMISVSTPGVSIENGVIKVGDIEVKAPSEVIVGDITVDMKNVTLVVEGGKPVYKVHATPKQKLFWLFPVTVDTDVTLDAQDGTTIKIETPWWDFLAA